MIVFFSCVICQSEFNFGERLIKLPCLHQYHTKCISEWLKMKKVKKNKKSWLSFVSIYKNTLYVFFGFWWIVLNFGGRTVLFVKRRWFKRLRSEERRKLLHGKDTRLVYINNIDIDIFIYRHVCVWVVYIWGVILIFDGSFSCEYISMSYFELWFIYV